MLDISIFIGLVVMLCWGVAGFLMTIPTRKIGVLKTQFISNGLALIPTTIVTILFFKNITISSFNLFLIILSGFFMVGGIYNFYKGIEIGDVSLISSINGAYSMITVILAVLLLGEKLSIIKIASIVLIFSGLFLASVNLKKFKELKVVKGIKFAIIGMVLQGIQFFIIGILAKEIMFFGIHSATTSSINVYIFTGFIYSALFIGFAASKKQVPRLKELKHKYFPLLFLATTIMFAGAWLLLNYGISIGNVSILMPITSLNPIVAIILAVIFYKEKLVLNQKLGILTILIGLFMISI